MSNVDDNLENAEPGGAGGTSIAGYDYQIDVSIWLALDLVLANKFARELVLEPASQEDLEADLAENEPGRLTSTAGLDGYRLIVQAKLRTGDAWTVPNVKTLLEHGDARPSAAARLADKRARYLLVTTAALNGGTRGLRVRRAGSWPKPDDMPTSIKNALPAEAAGRVAIIGNEDEERLGTDIKTLLTESFRVPNARIEECRRILREEAHARIRGAGGGLWTRSQLEETIRRHDGYIASSPELEHYVHPTNWEQLVSLIEHRHAALIVGQSGTGKTMASWKLFDELREKIPGLARIPIKYGPDQLRDDKTKAPVLYDIEDPWGRYDFDPKSRPWNDQVAQFFASARPDRIIVATSRLDVAQSAGVLDSVKLWCVKLEAEHYGPKERRQLYRTRIDALPRELRLLASESEGIVLAELATPLEIQKFFDALPTLDNEKRRNPSRFISEAIRRAHQNSIEQTVVNQIAARDDVRAAAVLWGLLKASDKLSLTLLRQIEEHLADYGTEFERGVSPLVTFFVAARNLRQAESTVTYYHPRVEAGIEKALGGDRLVARRALAHLVDVLVSPEGPDEAWGVAAAARMLAAADRKQEFKPKLSSAAQAKIDTWLETELAKGGKDFEHALELAAAAGSDKSNMSEVARFLLHRPDETIEGLRIWGTAWGPPKHDDTWYAQMQADPRVKALMETFVRNVLPRVHDTFDADFATEAERIAPGLTPAFLAAAAVAVHYGFMHADDAIAEGALNDLAGFEAIVDTAIKVLTPSDAERQSAADTRLAIINGEYSDEYAEHISNNDDGYTAGEFLAAYVRRVRTTVGWRHLASHRHRARLLSYWFRELTREETLEPDEVAGAFEVARGVNDEDYVWTTLLKAWNGTFERELVQRVEEGHPDPRIRTAALTCLVERAAERLPAICTALAERQREDRLIEIAIELGELRNPRSQLDSAHHDVAANHAMRALPPILGEIGDAALALETGAIPRLSEDARQLLTRVPSSSEEVRIFKLSLDRHFAMLIPEDVRWLLEHAEEPSNAVTAIDATIRHGMIELVQMGLTHRFAEVVARSLKAVATKLTPPLSDEFLALAQHKGSPVRRALVEILDAMPHPEHQATLLVLAKDDWSPRYAQYGDDDEYPIARAAVAAIAKLGPIEAEPADQLYRLAIGSPDRTLRYEIFALLVRAAETEFQNRLLTLALTRGRRQLREAAATALMVGYEHVVAPIVRQITSQLVETLIETVASRLLVLVAASANVDDVMTLTGALSTNQKRRVFLLLAIWVLRERDAAAMAQVAAMLPANHIGVKWAMAGGTYDINEAALDDLGDPHCVQQTLQFIGKKPKKR